MGAGMGMKKQKWPCGCYSEELPNGTYHTFVCEMHGTVCVYCNGSVIAPLLVYGLNPALIDPKVTCCPRCFTVSNRPKAKA